MRSTPILAVLLLAGCATSTGVLPTGPDTYSISVERPALDGGRSAARRVAFTEAASYCRARSLQSQILEANPFGGFVEPDTGIDLAFTCVPLNAPGPSPQSSSGFPAIGSGGGS